MNNKRNSKEKQLLEYIEWLYLCGDFESAAKVGEGLMAPRVGIVANHEANTVVRLLLGVDEV